MYFSSSITVIILLKYRYRQYRYRYQLENEYRYRQKKWYRYTSTRESNVSSAISSHVSVNQMNDILVACVQVIAVVYVRQADTIAVYSLQGQTISAFSLHSFLHYSRRKKFFK